MNQIKLWLSSRSIVLALGIGCAQVSIPEAHAAVLTMAATTVLGTSAQLNGHFYLTGSGGFVYFLYGLDVNYSTGTPGVYLNSSSDFSATISGLSIGTTYHFTAVLVPTVGSRTYGGDLTFTTVGQNPPTVQTTSATAVGATSAHLNATIDPLGGTTIVYFDYGTTTNYGSKSSYNNIGTLAQNFGVTVTNLAPRTTYHFRAVGYNVGGTNQGSDLTLTTTAIPPRLVLVKSGTLYGVSFAGETGRTYRVDGSDMANPANWTPLTTNALVQTPFTYYDPNSPGLPRRFYRAVVLP